VTEMLLEPKVDILWRF